MKRGGKALGGLGAPGMHAGAWHGSRDAESAGMSTLPAGAGEGRASALEERLPLLGQQLGEV